MKHTLSLSLLIFTFSCDSDEEIGNVKNGATAVVKNLTDLDLTIRLNLGAPTEFIFITANENTIGYSSQSTINEPKIMMLDPYDSIDVIFSDDKMIRFFRDDYPLFLGKNIFDSADWILENDTVLFSITEQDYNLAQ